MLQKIMRELRGSEIAARDGRIGSVEDVFFDDERWAVRYLVVDTANGRPGRHVLVSPRAVERVGPGEAVRVALTRDQVEKSPGADRDMPVSRQFEEAYAQYFGYPFYWDGPYLWGTTQRPISGTPPVSAAPSSEAAARMRAFKEGERHARESHLRSAAEVAGYRVMATDGVAGHVEDFVVDEDDWAITGLLVDAHEWLPARPLVVALGGVERIDWITREVRLHATREEVMGAPQAS